MPAPQKTAQRSLESLGFNQDDKLEEFLQLDEQQQIEQKFESVFKTPSKPKLARIAPEAEAESEELSLDGEEFMASDPNEKELDIGGDELSLSDAGDLSESVSTDDGLDLSDDGSGLSLSDMGDPAPALEASAGLNELDGSDSGIEATMTGLKLGDDLDLGDDVIAKMQEIDEIMAKDATNVRNDLPTDGAGDEDDLSFSSGAESNVDDLLSGAETLTASDATFDDQLEKSLVFETAEDLGLDPIPETELELPKKPAPKPKAPPVALPEPPEELFATTAVEDEGEIPAPPVPVAPSRPPSVPPAAAQPARAPAPSQDEYRQVVGNYNAELERLQATMNHLRTDRESLLQKIDGYEEEKIHHQRQLLGLRAELDEKKIETQLMKKRMADETQDLRYSLQLEQERRFMADEKNKALAAEIQALQQKLKLEVRKVSGHERELEQQLELLKKDAETQIRHRDLKILELKRRLDAMEFDVENMSALEKKTQENKQELEVKLDKAIRTLRAAIGILEVDDPKLATLEKLKKNLDV